MSATSHTEFESFATNVSPREVGTETVIDFDIDANNDYEIQSCAMVEGGEVVEAAVRFGRVETNDDIGVGKPILYSAWQAMADDTLGDVEYEADLSDFEHIVPHLRVRRENIEEYGATAMSVAEFVAAVKTLAGLVETVLRADTETMDAAIDEWL